MKKLFVVLLFAVQLLAAPAVAETKIQCWTDDNGHRSCGDRVPPEYADRQREVMNERGVMVESRPRARTAEELKTEEDQRKRQAEEQKRAEQLKAYDRYLIESYQSVSDLEAMRAERLKALDTRIDLLKKAIEANQSQLDSLVTQKQNWQKNGKPVPKSLEAQIQEYRRANLENPKSLAQMQFERDKVTAQFDRDIARYNELKTVSISTP